MTVLSFLYGSKISCAIFLSFSSFSWWPWRSCVEYGDDPGWKFLSHEWRMPPRMLLNPYMLWLNREQTFIVWNHWESRVYYFSPVQLILANTNSMLWTFIFPSVFDYCLLEGYLSLELYTCVQHLPKSLASFLSFERPPKALEENWKEVHQAQFIGAAGMA